MQVMRFHTHSIEVGRNLFCELDGHDRDKAPLFSFNASVDLGQQVVDLTGCWTNLNLRVEQPGWAEFHFCNTLDALQHIVHRFRFRVLLGQIRLSCPAARW